MVQDKLRLGSRIRALRRGEGLSQAKMAERLGISPSYLNMIEHNQRPLNAQVLLRLAQEIHLDLKSFAGGEEEPLVADLVQGFGDSLLARVSLGRTEGR